MTKAAPKTVDHETALEEVMSFLDTPPAPGTDEDERFGARLRQVISASIPLEDGEDPEDAPKLELDEGLRGRLEAAERKRSEGNYFGDHPDGIGSTLGMDLRHS